MTTSETVAITRRTTTPHPTHVQYSELPPRGSLSKLYLRDNHRLPLIKSIINGDMEHCSHEERKGGEPCAKPCVHKQGLPDKFLYYMDEALGAILDGHPLPVFVAATAPVAERFARITRNDRHIGVYIHEHRLESTDEGLPDLLQPYLNDWSDY